MAEFVWTPRSPLKAEASARLGRQDGSAGVVLREIRGFDLALVACRRGRWGALNIEAKRRFGVEAPQMARALRAGDALLIWSGPEQFLVVMPRGGMALADELTNAFGDTASVSDQSNARCLLAVGGPLVRNVLAKLISIDLDDSAFPFGSAATTIIDHTNVVIWRGLDDRDIYHILCPTSYAESLWHAAVDAAAEFGIDKAQRTFGN
ncbi:sarcosine oxidase subunit gamma family protein [Mesorhizobium sp. SB112]|uniref:sarcosine oxidase subunit gamma n=1 Tax=Mesorhizobium sp. SB112 TaxID=3151853 RepID=UPI0032671560